MDLNLVRVFVAVHEARSMTLASERLHVTQPAVSQALGRLRRQLGDPLFERTGHGVRPTPLAETLFEGLRDGLAGIDRTLEAAQAFDPVSADRTFRIALSELGEIGWLPTILDAVRTAAPFVRVEVVHLDTDDLPEWLARGTVDLAITPDDLPVRFRRSYVKHQRYAVVMSASNPLADLPLTAQDYRRASRVAVAGDSGVHLIATAHARLGNVPPPAASVQHFATLPLLLARSADLVATIPESIATNWAEAWPLAVRALPFDMTPITLRLYRRTATHDPAALDWFSATVARAVAGSEGEFATIRGGI